MRHHFIHVHTAHANKRMSFNIERIVEIGEPLPDSPETPAECNCVIGIDSGMFFIRETYEDVMEQIEKVNVDWE